MKYTEFVKANFHTLPAGLSAKEKIKKIAELWRASGHAKTAPHARTAKGGDFFSDLGNGITQGLTGALQIAPLALGAMGMFGRGLEKKKRGRKAKGGNIIENQQGEQGAGFIDDLTNGLTKGLMTTAQMAPYMMRGHGLEKRKPGRPRKAKGGDFFSDLGDGITQGLTGALQMAPLMMMAGRGLEKRKRGRPSKAKGGNMAEVTNNLHAFGEPGQTFGGAVKKGKGKKHLSNSEIMQMIARNHKAKGGDFSDLFSSLVPLLPLLAL